MLDKKPKKHLVKVSWRDVENFTRHKPLKRGDIKFTRFEIVGWLEERPNGYIVYTERQINQRGKKEEITEDFQIFPKKFIESIDFLNK